jgi:hypothetical protein
MLMDERNVSSVLMLLVSDFGSVPGTRDSGVFYRFNNAGENRQSKSFPGQVSSATHVFLWSGVLPLSDRLDDRFQSTLLQEITGMALQQRPLPTFNLGTQFGSFTHRERVRLHNMLQPSEKI